MVELEVALEALQAENFALSNAYFSLLAELDQSSPGFSKRVTRRLESLSEVHARLQPSTQTGVGALARLTAEIPRRLSIRTGECAPDP
jgi:hypothetical protein